MNRFKTCLWIGRILSFLFLLYLVGSCKRKHLDLSQFQVETYYVAQVDGRNVVLYFDDVSHKSVSGRWYVEDCSVSKPHGFRAETGRAHRSEMRSDSLKINFDALPGGDTLAIDLLMDGGWRTLHFVPWTQPEPVEIDRSYLFHDSLYDVTVDKDVQYGVALGYWTSYPEPGNRDDYLSIVKAKMNASDLTQKYWSLKMDVYSPVTNDTILRPLLLLIHGGAFFNGDKASAGYAEWGRHFASLGYVVASINYRIGFVPIGQKHIDRAGYRAVQDAHAAMCYLLRHPESYHIDPNLLFVGGTSAGGITALNLAFMTDADRPDCTKSDVVNDAAQAVSRWPVVGKYVPDDLGMEDLGGINAVAGMEDVDFEINAVVNMWGALHEVRMLGNSPHTAILSFHGDADSVVAYGYDYPFTKVKTPARDFIHDIRNVLKVSRSDFFKMTCDALEGLENSLVPINQFVCGKMYGSKCIHEKAKDFRDQGMLSELHTKAGGGHSLHVDDDGSLSDYYTLITDTTTRFLYLRAFPCPTLNLSCESQQHWYGLDNAGEVKTCQWEAEGGLVLEAESEKARVIFFGDADEHKLRISGNQKNGKPFSCEYDERGAAISWSD